MISHEWHCIQSVVWSRHRLWTLQLKQQSFMFTNSVLQSHLTDCFTVQQTSADLLAPGRFSSDFKSIIFKLIIQDSTLGTCCENALRWMWQNLTKTEVNIGSCNGLVPHQAASHYLSQYWPSSMSPYGITRPQWVKFIKTLLKLYQLFLEAIESV